MFFGIAALLIALTAVYFLHDLPNIDRAKPLQTRPGIIVLANDGAMIARYGEAQGDVVTMKDLPPHLVAAVLSVEDRRFYDHFGIDPIGLARAMGRNMLAGRWVQGGSTITQQLAKNMFLTPDRTLRRKVQEALLALQLEHRFSKDEILLAYLNRVYFGAGLTGVDAAAKVYFGKPVAQVTVWESAVLAGLLKAPSRLSPATHPDLALARAKIVIGTMEDAGYLDAKMAAQEIKNAKMIVMPTMAGDLHRYFTDWVIAQVDSFIASAESDIIIRTTLDPKMQLMAEAKLKSAFKRLTAEDRATQAALLTETHDGAVLAMIGGVDYASSQFNRATQALRQPGSAFKPFVYLAALETGFDPDDTIEDAPLQEGSYRPANHDHEYHGTVTLAAALAQSMNTATVRLLQMTGVGRLLDVAARAGFTHMPQPTLSAALGTDETTLLEMTTAYATISNGGHAVRPYAILSIRDGSGRLLYQRAPQHHPRVFAGRDIAKLDNMLTEVITHGTGKTAQLAGTRAAGKTGTTQDYRDAWFLGYAGDLVTGVWMGNDDNTPMQGVTGGKYPAMLWREYMNEALRFDVPAFKPEPIPAAVSSGNPFADMLDLGSPWEALEIEEPTYNR